MKKLGTIVPNVVKFLLMCNVHICISASISLRRHPMKIAIKEKMKMYNCRVLCKRGTINNTREKISEIIGGKTQENPI